MPRYKVFTDYGYAGCYTEDIVEAESEGDAEQMAWEDVYNTVLVTIEEIEDEEDE